ncbi:MAG: hypothetical protein HRT35_03635 [Algicola sp.]|nr:hypothetical protein [Algicola sp.]
MLSEQDHQLISASLDGELEPEQDLAFKRRLLQDPELNKQYQTLKALDQNLKNTFGDIANAPVPQQLAALLVNDKKVEDDQQQTAKNSHWRFLALAASVGAIGLLSFFGFQNSTNDTMSLALTKALNTQPSMEMKQLDQNSQFIALQSFRHNDGRVCREYLVNDTDTQSHLVACITNQHWQVEFQQDSALSESEYYVTVTAEENKTIEFYLKKAITGAKLSTDDELKQIKDGWL